MGNHCRNDARGQRRSRRSPPEIGVIIPRAITGATHHIRCSDPLPASAAAGNHIDLGAKLTVVGALFHAPGPAVRRSTHRYRIGILSGITHCVLVLPVLPRGVLEVAGSVDIELEEIVIVFGRDPDPERQISAAHRLPGGIEARLLIMGNGSGPDRIPAGTTGVGAIADYGPVGTSSAGERARNPTHEITLKILRSAARPGDIVEPDRIVALAYGRILVETPLEIV